LIDVDKQALQERVEAYFDHEVEWEELKALGTGLTQDAGGYKAKSARVKLLKEVRRNAAGMFACHNNYLR
jgi:hypothetical protein